MRKKFTIPETEAQRLRRLLRHWLTKNKIRLNDRATIKEALGMGDGSVHSLLTDAETISPELYIRTIYKIGERHSLGELLEREMLGAGDHSRGKSAGDESSVSHLLDENFQLHQKVRSLEHCLKEIETALKSIPCDLKALKGTRAAN